MKDLTVLLMPVEGGYRASVGALLLDTDSLIGFGTRVEKLLCARFTGDELEVEWALSRDLKPILPVCSRCNGTEKVEVEGIAAQYLANEFSEIDWTKPAEGTCPTCRGLGADIAQFWG
jgi:bacterioferritin-associated ferredoxin